MSTIVRPENITFRPQAGTCPPQLCPKALFPSAEASSLLQPRFRRRSAEDPSGKPGEGAGSFPATIRNMYVQTALPIAHTSPGQTGRRRNSMLHGIRHGPPGEGRKACVLHYPAGQSRIRKNSPVSAVQAQPGICPGKRRGTSASLCRKAEVSARNKAAPPIPGPFSLFRDLERVTPHPGNIPPLPREPGKNAGVLYLCPATGAALYEKHEKRQPQECCT